MAEKKDQWHLYYMRFGSNNLYASIHAAMSRAFDSTDEWIAFDPFTFLVHTSKEFADIQHVIGVEMVGVIDDFMVMQVAYDSAMSTFTDRHDILSFLISIKRNAVRLAQQPTQAMVDRVLDKLSSAGRDGLTPEEVKLLDSFASGRRG